MKRIAILVLLAVQVLLVNAQQQYVAKNGKVHFFSYTPIENIEATTNSAICAMSPTTGKVYVKINTTTFVFRDKLMEEHFNENYMESDRFPNAILDMTIANTIDYTKDGVYDVTLKGTLEMHGVKKEREIKGKLTVKNGEPSEATAEFEVFMADHNIKIPQAVIAKIAESVKVDAHFNFVKYEKK
ncbi:MAG: YceI family protein [Chitinophagales bacterium]